MVWLRVHQRQGQAGFLYSPTIRREPLVLALDHKVRATNFTRELGLLANKLELVGELRWNIHAHRKFEANRTLAARCDRIGI